MATVKIKFRPSTVDGGQGAIFYQVIHNRVVRQQKTGYRLYGYEQSITNNWQGFFPLKPVDDGRKVNYKRETSRDRQYSDLEKRLLSFGARDD